MHIISENNRLTLCIGSTIKGMYEKFNQNIHTSQELNRLNISEYSIRKQLERGVVRRLFKGIYINNDFASSLSSSERHIAYIFAFSKVLKKPVLCHSSAALFLGVPLLSIPSKIHYALGNNSGWSHPKAQIHRNRAELCSDAVLYQGIYLADIGDIITDCSYGMPHLDALCIAHYFLHAQRVQIDEVKKSLEIPRRYHRARAQLIAERLSDQCESPLETILWSRFYDWKIPLPEQQVPFGSYQKYGGYRVDFLWREKRVILEADGNIKYSGVYGDPVEIIRQERQRHMELERRGYRVLRTDWNEAMNSPGALFSRLIGHQIIPRQ